MQRTWNRFLTKIQFSIWINPINLKIFAFDNGGVVCSLKSEKKIILIAFLCKILIWWLYLIFWSQAVQTCERCDWKIAEYIDLSVVSLAYWRILQSIAFSLFNFIESWLIWKFYCKHSSKRTLRHFTDLLVKRFLPHTSALSQCQKLCLYF